MLLARQCDPAVIRIRSLQLVYTSRLLRESVGRIPSVEILILAWIACPFSQNVYLPFNRMLGIVAMKLMRKSSKPSFQSQNAGLVNQHKKMAMGKQGQTAVTVNPGARGSRKPGMRKS